MSFFEVDADRLRNAGPAEGVEIFARLLYADAWRMKIPFHKVHISAEINKPDGGIDARVEAHNSLYPEGAILRGETCYQIKTGVYFKP